MDKTPKPSVNDPSGYYAEDTPSLVWEMTICQCLGALDSPYQSALNAPAPYGAILAEFLVENVGPPAGGRVVEVGGGTGTLMEGYLNRIAVERLTMVDISRTFSGMQRDRLVGRTEADFLVAHCFDWLDSTEECFDLVISNENIGDFPTATNLSRDKVLGLLDGSGVGEGALETEVAGLCKRYSIDLYDAPDLFHFNLGAIRYLEKLAPRAKNVFLSEHGADTVIPETWAGFLKPVANGFPRCIPLKDHDEYSISFGQLAVVGENLGYRTKRLHMLEMLGVRSDEGARSMAATETVGNETAEVVHEFLHHVKEYQCLLLMRD